ncbi:MAG TPA: cyclic nucleotide-binding domain-containing protein [Ramlibacter sp.]|nr:cyclic nucleotide-binding domain-containing protein [Ramlibacter sp.]
MPAASSFTPIPPAGGESRIGVRAHVTSALDAAAFAIPLSLGSAALVFGRVVPDLLASGVFAVMLALVSVHIATAGSARPVVFAARFFEATTLVALMEQLIVHLPSWGLAETRGVKLAILCLIGGFAGVWLGALYLMRVDRFSRYIPAPVFAGFSNSIAVALVVSQTQSLWKLAHEPGSMAPALSIAATVLATAIGVRYWRPRWPAAAVGLAVGLATGLAWLAAGHRAPALSTGGFSMTLPLSLADFSALAAPGVSRWPLTVAIATNAAILGTMIFINTTLTTQLMTQLDERRRPRTRESLWTAAVVSIAGALGSVPISGSAQSSLAATRTSRLTAGVLIVCAAATAAVYLSGVLAWVPLAALCGALLCEAWFMVDRGSARLFATWLRARPLGANAREDLALVAAVTTSAIVFNMVVAIFVGLMLGFVLFAARNARKPVRCTWTGAQLHSNCARSRADLRLLTEHGAGIIVFELEGDLFFGSVEPLDTELRAGLQKASFAILDWSRVRHVDSSVAQAIVKVEQQAARLGVPVRHAGTGVPASNVGDVLMLHIPRARMAVDLDHALEEAENHVIKVNSIAPPPEVTALLEAASLFQGLDDAERNRLEACMEQRLFDSGQSVFTAGAPSDELVLVLHGSASILVRSAEGREIRLASVRRGATIGEIGFLDRAPRSASVVAQEHMMVAVLKRATYDRLCEEDPRLVRKLLSNIALDVATRLRHTNRLAIARTWADRN